MISNLMYIAHTLGLTTSQVIGMCGLTSIVVGLKTYKGINEIIAENTQNQHEKMKTKKKSIELKEFDEELEKQKAETEKALEIIKLEKKQREIAEYKMIGTHADPQPYHGIKPENRHSLLLGYGIDYQPIWGNDTNYIVAGSTGCGKTRKLYALLLNYLANRQGIVYICDLKGTDFPRFQNCKNVALYINELENVFQVIVAFKTEIERRKELFRETNCIDITDYNTKYPTQKLTEIMLIIDEYADIADCFTKNHKPIGVYKDIIEIARKCRAFGGRIILGTQRPSADVICGTLKANCSILGMLVVNSLNSKIMIDVEGCEDLLKCEALTIIQGKLEKVFSYNISDIDLTNFTQKLK